MLFDDLNGVPSAIDLFQPRRVQIAAPRQRGNAQKVSHPEDGARSINILLRTCKAFCLQVEAHICIIVNDYNAPSPFATRECKSIRSFAPSLIENAKLDVTRTTIGGKTGSNTVFSQGPLPVRSQISGQSRNGHRFIARLRVVPENISGKRRGLEQLIERTRFNSIYEGKK